ncbi:hypothetical protein Sru01_10460 [Sphaerisporangium rufum]|uniref:Uncharacterized protein n=1 Tax=Sphaerisporangium rufum TaxID=1381558 RepID=A0A919UXP5_9ACTN|nr:hypothetical protein Sru01_10460 [Sphaerisporangium rufum]
MAGSPRRDSSRRLLPETPPAGFAQAPALSAESAGADACPHRRRENRNRPRRNRNRSRGPPNRNRSRARWNRKGGDAG